MMDRPTEGSEEKPAGTTRTFTPTQLWAETLQESPRFILQEVKASAEAF